MRSKVLVEALAKYGIEPCGDSSCIYGSPGGMATNGGCRCIEKREIGRWPYPARQYIQKLAAALRDVAAMCEKEER